MAPDPTIVARLGPAAVLSSGSKTQYRAVASGPGEGRLVRCELAERPAGRSGQGASRRRSLLYLAQVSDLQLADLSSPGRFEFLEELRGRPGTESFVPAQRPQEALCAHAVDAMARRIASLGESTDTGASLRLAISTGDNIDNAQWNELCWYLALIGGGAVDPGGGHLGSGVQQTGWPGELYWKPDGGPDLWRSLFGYPEVPGLLGEAAGRFEASGVGVEWLSCFGNHDGLPFGEAVPTAAYKVVVVGGHKAISLPDGVDPLSLEESFFERPELFCGGPGRAVAPDPGRRIVGRREFVAAHLAARGLPRGHGFSEANLAAGTAYGSHDVAGPSGAPGVRVVILDTTNLDGWHRGSLGARQLAWLEEELASCHSRYMAPDGSGLVSTPNDDSLVVLASHHGLSTMTNLRQLPGGLEADHPRVDAGAVAALLARFPNVVCWINGHRHLNEIVPRPSDAVAGTGYWEVSTASIADWPSQGRLVELVDNCDGTLSLLTAMIDHAGPADPRAAGGLDRLAALHRELAANVPGAGFGSFLEGTPADRNCELVVGAPFDLG
ncbi:MAG: TIGR03767 family metallophosphoesterase [Acidimicrobiales bacterium]